MPIFRVESNKEIHGMRMIFLFCFFFWGKGGADRLVQGTNTHTHTEVGRTKPQTEAALRLAAKQD